MEIIIVILLVIILALVGVMFVRTRQHSQALILKQLEDKHIAMLRDLNEGLNRLGDRLTNNLQEMNERLRNSVAQELNQTRETLQTMQLAQSESLAKTRVEVLEKLHNTLSEQGKAEQELIQSSMLRTSTQLTESVAALRQVVDERLQEISGKVSERLEEGFKKTNETFTRVMERLATIDKAQEKIDGLTTNVVSLQALLGDKRSRGAFGEVQLEGLIRNIMPAGSFEMQHTLPNGNRADCVLFLPEPTGTVAVDSKFPLENYHRFNDLGTSDEEKKRAQSMFKADVKKHVDDISSKYIISGTTSDGAVMFIPAEAVFAEIHANHRDLIDYAMNKRVWVVSPTTLMAVLNTARAVLKDVETRKQVHIIKDELSKLSKDFGLFDKRMKNLADHIRKANDDVQDIHVTTQKISKRFSQIERVELNSNAENLPLSVEEIEVDINDGDGA
jgi:DNA recombination protein RmuC